MPSTEVSQRRYDFDWLRILAIAALAACSFAVGERAVGRISVS